MPFELWVAFFVTTSAFLAISGPTVLLVVSYAIGHGRSSGWATVPGVALGDFTAMTISLLGAGALLAASTPLFEGLKLAGAAYLIWLEIKLWRSEAKLESLQNTGPSLPKWPMFWKAYVVTALNPKSIVFLLPLFPNSWIQQPQHCPSS